MSSLKRVTLQINSSYITVYRSKLLLVNKNTEDNIPYKSAVLAAASFWQVSIIVLAYSSRKGTTGWTRCLGAWKLWHEKQYLCEYLVRWNKSVWLKHWLSYLKGQFCALCNFSLLRKQMAQSTKQWIFFFYEKGRAIIVSFALELQLPLFRKGSFESVLESSSVAVTWITVTCPESPGFAGEPHTLWCYVVGSSRSCMNF